MLYIVKSIDKLPLVISLLQKEDALLLTEAAVYAASERSSAFSLLSEHSLTYVLSEDLDARGWSEKASPLVKVVDMLGFVELTEQYKQSITW
ncbi:sulfurtransferase complex subunit TusB [Vibrio tritonius]|uniref:sulfurtransferase complex subunit TusB n=1 Tax=Vibrio tritonius TaxID=1435069 RepID=UPI000838D55A|nr:sulfurtransferase complex subunit TusB [Vibrio tritonius]